MPVDELAMRKAEVVQKDFEDHYGNMDKIVGIGIGLNAQQNDLALNVQVSDQSALRSLPRHYGGLDVVINVVGEVSVY